jgi:endonuclease YncB( thermonuclease family)
MTPINQPAILLIWTTLGRRPSGMAWHYAKYSQNCPSRAAIVAGETGAKAERLGIWQGFNTPAWEYRHSQKRR